MTKYSSSHDRLLRFTENAALLCAALMLSYVEAILPLTALIPLPGAKLGLANLAVMLAYHRRSVWDAAAVSLSRVLLSAILFGSVSSLAFSLTGAVFSLSATVIAHRCLSRRISWIGVSVLAAAAHNFGQILCAVLWMHSLSLFSYLPVLLILAAVFGAVSGLLMNILAVRIPHIQKKEQNL